MSNIKSLCGCSDDILCAEAKKLWKYKSIKNRKKYSDHRLTALRLKNVNGMSIWANNLKKSYE